MPAPAPHHAIARGRAGPGLLAHIAAAKFDDHLPLYRQAEIYAREVVDLATSTLSGWVGATAAALKPLVDLLRTEVIAGSDVLHGDDTTVPILAHGTGKTKTGRLWAYVRDERLMAVPVRRRPCTSRPPTARASPAAHLAGFSGVLKADGYSGFNGLYEARREGGALSQAACWAHTRRKFFDVHVKNGSTIALEALERIGAPYEVERTITDKPSNERRRRVKHAHDRWRRPSRPGPTRSCRSSPAPRTSPTRSATCWRDGPR